MNAAARLMHQNVLSRGWVVSVLLSKAQFSFFMLIAATLLSALSVVYVSYSTRTLNATIQQTFSERNRLHMQWSQLLLEKSTWIIQARVQNIAENKLDMIIPTNKSVVIVNE